MREISHAPWELPRTLLFAAAALCALLLSRLPSLGSWSTALAFCGIGLAMWHGAYDNALAKEAFEPSIGRRWTWFFYPAYLALAGLCLALWWLQPAVALTLFLLYSAVHFGTESDRQRTFGRVFTGLAAGLVPIAAACHWWPQAAGAIFTQMLRGEGLWGSLLTGVVSSLLWPSVAANLVGTLFVRPARVATSLGLLGAELCLFRWCTPLTAFAVYFCLWHTPEHLLSTNLNEEGALEVRRMWAKLRAGAWPWLLSVAGVLVFARAGRSTVTAYAGVLFIVLSALTVPHMVLSEVLLRRGLAFRLPKLLPTATQGAGS